MSPIPVRLGLQQRVLAGYRVPFFDALAGECSRGLGIFSGKPRPDEWIETGAIPKTAKLFSADNHHFLSGPFYLCWQSGLRQWLEDWQPQVLIVEANPRYLRTSSAISWMHSRRRPVIGWGSGARNPQGWLASINRTVRSGFLGKFDGIITYSQQGAEEYARAGIAEERIFVAPNAVAPRPVCPPPQRGKEFENGKARILFVGRLQARKRLDILLQACAEIPKSLQPELWIVGEGPARQEFELMAQRIYPETRFFGARYGKELEPIFHSADLFVLPGTGGLAVQQAMSFALPVMVAEADGTQADLVRPENGWLLTPGDTHGLASILGQALREPDRLREMGMASYRIVFEEINLEKMVQVFSQAICSVWEG